MAFNINPRPIMPFTEYNTFQGFYKIRPADEARDLNYVFNKSILHVTDWLRKRFEEAASITEFDASEYRFLDDYPSVESMEAEGFDVFASENMIVSGAGTRYDIDVLGIKDFGEWAIRIFEPNNGAEASYADRLFTTDIAIKITSDFVYLAIKTTCTESLLKHDSRAGMFRPVVLRNIVEDPELIVSGGNLAALKYPINIAKLNIDLKGNLLKDEYEFLNVIFDPKRQMPVVFCPASSAYDKLAYGRLIKTFSWNMSGEAYVITDEHGDRSDCYKGFFEKMYTNPKYDILKKAKIPVNEAMNKIKDNYLVIYPPVDGTCDIEWHAVNEDIKNYSSVAPKPENEADNDPANEAEPAPDAQAETAAPASEPLPAEPPKLPDGIKALIKEEVHKIRADVGSSLMARREASGCPDISYGDVVFYSELWNKYIDKSDSKTIEMLRLKNAEYEHRLDEMIKNRDAYSKDQIEEFRAKHDKEVENSYNDLQKERDTYRQRLKDAEKQLNIEQDKSAKAEKAIAEYTKKKAASEKILSLQSDLIDFYVRFMSVPYEKKNLLKWIEETMSDRVTILTQAKQDYDDLYKRIDDDGTRLRDACILMYAYMLKESGDESMPEDLYNAIEESGRMSAFTASPTGRTESMQHCLKQFGHKADHHIRYGGSFSNDMFRIYFDFDQETKKYLIVSVTDHVKGW